MKQVARQAQYLISTLLITAGMGLTSWFAFTSHLHRPTSPTQPYGGQAPVRNTPGQLLLSFEENRGQTVSEVRFLSRSPGYSLFLTPRETVLALRKPDSSRSMKDRNSEVTESQPAVLRMKLVGSNPAPNISGTDQLPGKSHYLLGNDPDKWHRNIPHYAKVKYESVYPGIDLVYYGNGHQLEYDFIVAPGADPQQIKLSFEGGGDGRIDSNGDLVLDAEGGEIRQQKPLVYQEIAGERQEIAGSYVKTTDDQIGFQIASYDASRPLVIDPVLVYSTYLGGTGDDVSSSVAVDGAGNAYVTGSTASLNFPTTHNTQPNDAFVTKLDASGSALVYSVYFGGSSNDRARDIAVDGAGHAYIVGETISRDFPITPGAYQSAIAGTSSGIPDVFVMKLDSSGSALIYSTYLGGTGVEVGSGIAVDGAGRAYVTGETLSLDFPTTSGALQPARAGIDDVFVTKLNAKGSTLVYSTYLGGSRRDVGFDIAVDGAGHAYVTGQTVSLDFPTTTGAFQLTSGGGPFDPFDGFVAKVNRRGSALVYSTYLGGSNNDFGGDGIAVDGAGHAYVVSTTVSVDFPTTPGAFQPINRGLGDVVVTKLNRRGSALIYSTYLGGRDDEQNADIAIDGAGHAYVSGHTFSPDFPTTPDALQRTAPGSLDVFVTKLNRRGSALLYSTYLGATAPDYHSGIAVDGAENAYVTGYTMSRDFPVVSGAFQPAHAGGTLLDAFVAKIGTVDDNTVVDDDDDGVETDSGQ
jgi:hypothetical protein